MGDGETTVFRCIVDQEIWTLSIPFKTEEKHANCPICANESSKTRKRADSTNRSISDGWKTTGRRTATKTI